MDALNQELYELWMGKKETVLDWGVHLSRHLQVLAASFPDRFPLDQVTELKQDHSYGGLPKLLKAIVAYLKATPNEKTYSDYLHAAWEAEKETMEPSCSHTAGSPAKPKATSFFPLRKLKGNQPTKTPVVQLAHFDEEASDDEEGTDSKDPDGFNGCYGGIHGAPHQSHVKYAQQDEKCCYHCSSWDHFIRDCPLVKLTRKGTKFKLQRRDGAKERGPDPPIKVTLLEVP